MPAADLSSLGSVAALMQIRQLSFVEYDESGSTWREAKISAPKWDDVVAAIDRLDRFRYPWVWLFTGDNHQDPTIDCLTIMGGDGTFWVGLSAGKHSQLRLFNPNKSDTEVELWTSDQGFSDCEFHTTNDIKLVLKIAKHFGETGEPLPGVSWED